MVDQNELNKQTDQLKHSLDVTIKELEKLLKGIRDKKPAAQSIVASFSQNHIASDHWRSINGAGPFIAAETFRNWEFILKDVTSHIHGYHQSFSTELLANDLQTLQQIRKKIR